MLANILNQWSNYLFHEGEIGLLHNGLTISVCFFTWKNRRLSFPRYAEVRAYHRDFNI